jgi:DNA-binding phage protein
LQQGFESETGHGNDDLCLRHHALLTDDTTIVNYLNDCLEEGGSRLFLVGVGDGARSAWHDGPRRVDGHHAGSALQSIGRGGESAFATIERVLEGLGFGLAVVRKATPIRKRVSRPRRQTAGHACGREATLAIDQDREETPSGENHDSLPGPRTSRRAPPRGLATPPPEDYTCGAFSSRGEVPCTSLSLAIKGSSETFFSFREIAGLGGRADAMARHDRHPAVSVKGPGGPLCCFRPLQRPWRGLPIDRQSKRNLGTAGPDRRVAGLELLGTEYLPSPGGAVLRLYIDVPANERRAQCRQSRTARR